MRSVLCVIGTRPEAIKMAPVILALRRTAGFRARVLATGQHREMVDQVLPLFGIVPDIDLGLMRPGQTLTGLTGRMLLALEGAFAAEAPDVVLGQGDTTTVLATALAAFHAGIPFGHVEAGLRTGAPRDPFPEEMNRVLTAHLARWHFAPTAHAAAALRAEGHPEGSIHVTGNTVIDALSLVAGRQAAAGHPQPELHAAGTPGRADAPDAAPPAGASEAAASCPAAAGPRPRRSILVTLHRRENLGAPLARICAAIRTVAETNPDVEVLLPVHRNPAVRDTVTAALGGHPRIALAEPLGYADFVAAMRRAHLVLTDSGGVQEEAPALGKPVLVLRETTERPEALAAGVTALVGTDPRRIVARTQELLDDPAAYARMAQFRSPYGDGRAAERIVGILAAA